jgi:hypothetical protein
MEEKLRVVILSSKVLFSRKLLDGTHARKSGQMCVSPLKYSGILCFK